MTRVEIFLQVAKAYLGTPYRWGGDDPSGFDCSGLVIECLQSVGALDRGTDDTAHGLLQRYVWDLENRLFAGDLVFWVNPRTNRAYHVGIVIDPPELYLGAEGGGSSTQRLADAWKRNAYVKVRPLASRRPERQVFRRWR